MVCNTFAHESFDAACCVISLSFYVGHSLACTLVWQVVIVLLAKVVAVRLPSWLPCQVSLVCVHVVVEVEVLLHSV